MSEPVGSPPARSGCALVMGVLLIATGVLFLAQNLFDYSLFRFLASAIPLFTRYWPLLLVLWGLVKIYQRYAAPGRARVSALEIVLLVFVVGIGLTLRAAHRLMGEASVELDIERIAELAGVAVPGVPVHRFSEEQLFELGPGNRLLVASPGGEVIVRGVEPEGGEEDRGVRVVATKRIRHHSETEAARIAESVEVGLESGPATSRLEVASPREAAGFEVDLEIRVPKSAAVSVHNRRGRVELSDLTGAAEVETSRDRLEARNLAGGLRAEVRHGDIRVADLAGGVVLSARGGSISAERIAGDLEATASHGSLRAIEVTGGAVLANRHADIRASRIEGPVQVTATNAAVSIESAGADVVIRASHAPVFVRGVAGALTIEARNAAVQARDIRGDVRLDDENEAVTLIGVSGAAIVRSPRSRVLVERVEGPLEIESSHEEVRVGDFGSTLAVRSSHAPLRISAARLAGAVTAETSYGDVTLVLPPGAAMEFQGRARDGSLRSSISRLELREGTDEEGVSWTGSLGAGGPRVSLATRFGDVVLETAEP